MTLGQSFSPAGVVVPGPEPGTFWALPPLLMGEREIRPLSLIVFPETKALQTAFCAFHAAGLFIPDPPASWVLALLDSLVAAVVREMDGPVIVLSRVGEVIPSLTPRDYFLSLLAHEIAHWATSVWTGHHGLDMTVMPDLLVESLAEYTQIALTFGAPDRNPAAPSLLHPIAAAWAERGGLADAPWQLDYHVGLSLVDFLVRKYYHFVRVLDLLPDFLDDWSASLGKWDGEWREWLRGEVPPRTQVIVRLLVENVFFVASLVERLIPSVWDLLRAVTSEEGVAQFWDSISGPVPTPGADARGELRARECVFRLMTEVAGLSRQVREQVEAFLARLGQHWDAEDWDAYAETYLEAVRALIKPVRSLEKTP